MQNNANNKIAISVFLLTSAVVSCRMNRQDMGKHLPNELLFEMTQCIKRDSIEEFWRSNSVTKTYAEEKLYKLYKNSFNELDTFYCKDEYFLIAVNEPILRAAAVKAFKENTTMTTIKVSEFRKRNPRIISPFSWNMLAEILKENNTVRTINLGDGIIAGGLATLAEALKVNKTITTIKLNGTYINNADIAALVEALKVNKTITTIELVCDGMTNGYIARLAEAIRNNTTITIFPSPFRIIRYGRSIHI
ncbi:hypothetical protein [Candidatus Cardinium hertigii]|uniref:Uncharacterized protein n=1 Tax=Candidatus Cardinium hertigii TaxID=247481 RepID=A0A2Z3L9H5_9BACT|nr:hypothetical protein [Candidatus Cardinium hertigii]AWN82183.1 hypothetical protein DK880_00884 [Candidatus Cardinium hertigii]